MQSISSFPGFAEQSREKLKEAGINATDAQIESAIEAFRDKNYKLEQNNAGHLNSIAQTEEYKRWFFAKSWRFHIANGGKQFITSDTPVIEIFNKGRTLAEQMYGNHIMQRRHFYALTPNILVELTDPLKFKKRIKRNIVSDHEVIQHNLLRAGYSKSYCYSQRRAELEDLGVYYEGGTNVKRAVAEYLRDKRRQSEL